MDALFVFGLPDRIRTCGLKSRSLALYPAGLRVDTFGKYITFRLFLQDLSEKIPEDLSALFRGARQMNKINFFCQNY